MGCVFITGVGVAGAIPETDVDYYFFLKKITCSFCMENFRHMQK